MEDTATGRVTAKDVSLCLEGEFDTNKYRAIARLRSKLVLKRIGKLLGIFAGGESWAGWLQHVRMSYCR